MVCRRPLARIAAAEQPDTGAEPAAGGPPGVSVHVAFGSFESVVAAGMDLAAAAMWNAGEADRLAYAKYLALDADRRAAIDAASATAKQAFREAIQTARDAANSGRE